MVSSQIAVTSNPNKTVSLLPVIVQHEGVECSQPLHNYSVPCEDQLICKCTCSACEHFPWGFNKQRYIPNVHFFTAHFLVEILPIKWRTLKYNPYHSIATYVMFVCTS